MRMPKALVGPLGTHGHATGPRAGPAPVLVIDDERAGAATALERLAEAGYPTAAEADGDAVLRLVRAEPMRLVVSELHVPCAEGPCVVAALKRERARLPRLRVLVHSRHTGPADDAWALAAGADGVLHKPASAGALVREVRWIEGADPVEPSAGTDRGRSGPGERAARRGSVVRGSGRSPRARHGRGGARRLSAARRRGVRPLVRGRGQRRRGPRRARGALPDVHARRLHSPRVGLPRGLARAGRRRARVPQLAPVARAPARVAPLRAAGRTRWRRRRACVVAPLVGTTTRSATGSAGVAPPA